MKSPSISRQTQGIVGALLTSAVVLVSLYIYHQQQSLPTFGHPPQNTADFEVKSNLLRQFIQDSSVSNSDLDLAELDSFPDLTADDTDAFIQYYGHLTADRYGEKGGVLYLVGREPTPRALKFLERVMSGRSHGKNIHKDPRLNETARIFPELIGLQTLELLMDQADDKAVITRVMNILSRAAQHPENRIRARAWELLEKFHPDSIEVNVAGNEMNDEDGLTTASASTGSRTIRVERVYRQVRAVDTRASAANLLSAGSNH